MQFSSLMLRASAVALATSMSALNAQGLAPTYVDALGNVAPRTTVITIGAKSYTAPLFDTCDIFIDVPDDLPAGDYRVRVFNAENLIEVAPRRVYSVSYDGNGQQVITPPTGLGVGLGGAGFSIALGTLDLSGVATAYPCAVKPYLDQDLTGTGTFGLYRFGRVAFGDGSGSDVCGVVFDDLDENGVRDSGEPGLEGVLVSLDNGSRTATTDQDGIYCFTDLAAGAYQLSVDFGSYPNTTPTSAQVTVGGCCPVTGASFGRGQMPPTSCQGRTPGYWSGPHGMRYLRHNPDALASLRCLNLWDARGHQFDPATPIQFSCWLRGRSARNMAYQLSGQFAAMWLNIHSGKASLGCRINDPELGRISLQELIDMAIIALMDGCTPVGDPNRAIQERIKNALDRANNNITWG